MRDANQPSFQSHDRAITSITQRICGILALNAGFEASSVGALTRLGDIALNRKLEFNFYH